MVLKWGVIYSLLAYNIIFNIFPYSHFLKHFFQHTSGGGGGAGLVSDLFVGFAKSEYLSDLFVDLFTISYS